MKMPNHKSVDYYEKKYNEIVDITMKFLDISLKRPNLELLIQCFGSVSKNPVVIYDEFFNAEYLPAEYLEDYNRDEQNMEQIFMKNLFYYKQKVFFTDTKAPQKECIRLLFPVLLNDMAKGYLAIFDVKESYEEINFEIMEIFANTVLMEMKRLLNLRNVEEKYVSDFLYDLVFRKADKQEEIKRRAKVLHIEEKADYCILAVEPCGVKNDMRMDTNGYITRYEYMSDRIMNNIGHLMHRKYKRDVITKFDKTVLILHRMCKEGRDSGQDVKEECRWLQKELNKLFDGMVFQIGIGTVSRGIDGIDASYRQALSSLSYGELLYSKKQEFIIAYNDSSLLKVFSTLKETESVYEIIPKVLLELRAWDEKSKSNLFETLRTYLECNCNAKKASEKMYIHYKTMLYRLEKIQKEFAIGLDDGILRIQIELGIQMLDIMDMQNRK